MFACLWYSLALTNDVLSILAEAATLLTYSGGARFESRPKTNYPGSDLLWFSSVRPGKFWGSTLN
jgi:hypothetical protein